LDSREIALNRDACNGPFGGGVATWDFVSDPRRSTRFEVRHFFECIKRVVVELNSSQQNRRLTGGSGMRGAPALRADEAKSLLVLRQGRSSD